MQDFLANNLSLLAQEEASLADVLLEAFLFQVIGGLGIFLLGMKFMSEGMQAVAGNKLRLLISSVTNNKYSACAIGTMVTCIVQSSSVTTVMAIGFVNGGFMTLTQAIGVIFGANIGTTVTGWILALKIGKWGLPILGISSFVYLFSKNEKLRFTAMAIMGIGMVFFGLETMASGFKDQQVNEVIREIFSNMDGKTYIGLMTCALVGCIATMIVQSSSATLGVTIALATTESIGYETAAGLILGLNIGTTVTAFLASFNTTTNAKRAAYAHITFNVVGTVIFLPFYFSYMDGVTWVMERFGTQGELSAVAMTSKIALTHTGFNVINTVLLFPFMGHLGRFVTKMIPDKDVKETTHLTFLDMRMLDTPALGIEQSHLELVKMGEMTEVMMRDIRDLISEKEIDTEKKDRIFKYEDILDQIQKEVVEFVGHILSGNIPNDVVDAGRQHLRIADELESVSDYIQNLMKLRLRLADNELEFNEKSRGQILDLHDNVAAYLKWVIEAVKDNKDVDDDKLHKDSADINQLMKDYRREHLTRVSSQEDSPMKSLIFTDMLSAYRKIKDHCLNAGEALQHHD
jgi:phosphate:Na+ symporter